jgi:hypothetical protein
MVLKATNNASSLAHVVQSKGTDRRAPKKGSRAKAQRAKIDAQAENRHLQEEQEAVVQATQHKKTGRQEVQAKRRLIEMLIEAYLQDHIGGNHSEKTLEWHRTALGLMHLFFKEKLDITVIDAVEADDISAWFAHMRIAPGAHGKVRSEQICIKRISFSR